MNILEQRGGCEPAGAGGRAACAARFAWDFTGQVLERSDRIMTKTLWASVLSAAAMAACSGDGPDERTYQPERDVQFVQAGGIEFAYLEQGDGPLVLLLHGFPDTAHTFDATRAALADAGFRAVSPFMRGYAPTAIPEVDADARTLGEDALALIEALGEDQAIVVGHDWGALAAYAAASLAPERVSRLVTIAIPHPITIDPEQLARAPHFVYLTQPDALDTMRADDFAHVEELYARWSPTWMPEPAEFEPVKNAFTAPGSLDAALGYYRAISPTPPDFFLAPIQVPTISFAGADDGVTPPEEFDEAIPMFPAGYEVVRMPGGHFLHRENPDEFISALLERLTSQPAP
jgi:pimeloyl-ACP methyl ester carboxylesterase